MERVRGARALVLEANHDVAMLQQDTRRPWSVKQRILSRHGHLSNEAAADLAAEVVGADLEELYLGHLSEDCNTPAKAREAVRVRLSALGHERVRLNDTRPDAAIPSLVWS